MRIGYLGFTEDADVLIPPPSEVTYAPATQARQELVTSGLLELRGYATLASYTLQLRWKDIPERDLSLLAFIPPQETVTLIDQAGKERLVVFDEPTRAMLTGVSTRDGSPLYSASLNAHPVQFSPLGASRLLQADVRVRTGKVTVPDAITPRDPPAPPAPTPTVSPIKARAVRGLPPTVEYGEGLRFTFDTFSDEVERGRYYSDDTDGYLELSYLAPQAYTGWYSHVRAGRNVEALLKRFPWQLDAAWTIGALLFIDAGLSAGTLLQGWGPEGVLSVSWEAGNLNLTLSQGGVLYFHTLPLPAGTYAYLGLQYAYGNFRAGLGGAMNPVPPASTPPLSTARTGLVLGGGPAYYDDLLIANSDNVDLAQVYAWLVG